jgi:hypothetical protein
MTPTKTDKDTTQAATVQTEPVPTTRLPFDAAFIAAVEQFCKTTMAEVPELQGIAIIPVWEDQPEKFPAGLLHLRNTQPPYMAALLKLLQRLVVFSADVYKDMLGQLRVCDQYAAELSDQIRRNSETLDQQTKANTPQE